MLRSVMPGTALHTCAQDPSCAHLSDAVATCHVAMGRPALMYGSNLQMRSAQSGRCLTNGRQRKSYVPLTSLHGQWRRMVFCRRPRARLCIGQSLRMSRRHGMTCPRRTKQGSRSGLKVCHSMMFAGCPFTYTKLCKCCSSVQHIWTILLMLLQCALRTLAPHVPARVTMSVQLCIQTHRMCIAINQSAARCSAAGQVRRGGGGLE